MGEATEEFRRKTGYRKRAASLKTAIPLPEYPNDPKFTVKSLAYLHVYCGKAPQEIVARFPRALSLADVHLALAHYYLNRDAIDAEIARERAFNTQKALVEPSMRLPSVGLSSLIEAAESPGRPKE